MERKGKDNNSNQQDQNRNRAQWVPVPTPVNQKPEVKPFSAEWTALKFLDAWDASTLEKVIERDERIPLSSFVVLVEDTIIKHLLDWFACYRPDLHEVLATERGIEWLKRNLRTIQKQQ